MGTEAEVRSEIQGQGIGLSVLLGPELSKPRICMASLVSGVFQP
jgi:hypothetical protein